MTDTSAKVATMRRTCLLFSVVTLLFLQHPQTAHAQADVRKNSVPGVAVLRMKPSGVTDANRELLQGYASRLNGKLATVGGVSVPGWDTVFEAIDDEGVEPEGLIDLDDCIDAAEQLGVRYFVIGSIEQRTMTLYAHARVYAMPEGRFVGVVSAALNAREVTELTEQLAGRLAQMVIDPPEEKRDYADFSWSQRLSFSFGTERYDLNPPTLYYVNDDPPFEIAVKVVMDRMFGMYVVTHFEIFADGEAIAAVTPDIEPPRPIREQEIEIAGRTFCFQATVAQLRTRKDAAISTATVDLTARLCDD